MSDFLEVPTFARFTDYAGLWILEQQYASSLWEFAKGLDLQAHMQHENELRSVMEMTAGPNGKQIAMVKLSGLLMKPQSSMGGTSTVMARKDIRNAAADPNVAGIMLHIDSPGGTVSGTHDLASEVQAARKMKPVRAHIEDLGASAAYWIASQTERITANAPTALVGSIGTIQVLHDMSQAAEQQGIRTLVFATGPLKGLGTPGSKVTDEQANHLQSLVNSVQLNFDAAVQKGRGMSAKELMAVRHGGVMTAPQAVDAKLIDGIQPLNKAVSDFANALKSGDMRAEETLAASGSLPMRELCGLPMRPL